MPYSKLQIFINLAKECKDKGHTTKEACETYLKTPRICRDKNVSGEKCILIQKLTKECLDNNILNAADCKSYVVKNALRPFCKNTVATTQEECTKLLYDHAIIAEGRGVKDPVAYLKRVNDLLVKVSGDVKKESVKAKKK